MKNTKFVKNQRGNLLVEAMLGIALAGAGFLIYYEIEHHIAEKKQFSKVTSDMYQQYNVFLTALDKYAQSNNSTQVVSCQTLKNGYLAQNFNCTDYLGDNLEGILVKNQTQTPTAYVVGVPSTNSQHMLHSYNVSSIQVLNQALAQSQPENTPNEFFVVNVNNYTGYPVTNISQSVSFSSIASYLPQQGLKLGNNSYVIALVDASTLNPSAAPPSCYSSSSILSPPGTWNHCFTNEICNTTCSGTVCTTSCTPSYTLCSYTEWQPYQYCSYVNGQTSTSNNGAPFTTSSCPVVNYCANQQQGTPGGGSVGGGSGNNTATQPPQPSPQPQPSQQPQQPTQPQQPGNYYGGGGGGSGTSGTAQPGGNVCPSGYVWNSYQQTCVNETQYTMACYPPYYNAVTNGPNGRVLCALAWYCPSGAVLGPMTYGTYEGLPVGYGLCEEVSGAQYTCQPGYTFNPSTRLCESGIYEQCPDYGLLSSLTASGWTCTLNSWCAINCTYDGMVISQGTYFPSNGTADTNPSDTGSGYPQYGYYQIAQQPTLTYTSATPVDAPTCPSDSVGNQGFHTIQQEPTCYDWGYFTSIATPLSCPAGTALNVYTGTCDIKPSSCPTGYIYIAEEGGCVPNCPNGTTYSLNYRTCVVVKNCPIGLYFNTNTLQCTCGPYSPCSPVGEYPCPSGEALDHDTNSCVQAPGCPDGSNWDYASGICVGN